MSYLDSAGSTGGKRRKWKKKPQPKPKKKIASVGLPGEGGRGLGAPKPVVPPKQKPSPRQRGDNQSKPDAAPAWVAPKNIAELNAIAQPQMYKSVEDQLGEIIHPYWQQNHSLPDAVTTMHILMNADQMPKDPRQKERMYKALWAPVMDANEQDAAGMRRGDFFQVESLDLANDPQYAPFQVSTSSALGARDRDINVKHRTTPQPTIDAYIRTKQYLFNLKEPWRANVSDGFGQFSFSASEFIAMKQEIARRLHARGVHVRFNPNSSEWDNEWEIVANKYVFAGQFAYQVLGNDTQNRQANDVMEKVRTSGGYGRDKLERDARKLGIKVGDWANSDSVASVLSAMRYATDDTTLTFCFDEFMFSRPIGMSEGTRRKEYVDNFGTNRLPAKQVAVYAQENESIMGAIAKATGAVGGLWENHVETNSVTGPLARRLHEFSKTPTKIINYPLAATMQGLTTAYLAFSKADTGWDFQEYRRQLAKNGGRDGLQDRSGFSWSELVDASNWAEAWDDAKGETPIKVVMEMGYLRKDGKIPAWASDAGSVADLAVGLYLGARAGDPVARAVIKTGFKGSYIVAKGSHKLATSYRIDLQALGKVFGPQGGFIDLGMPAGGNAAKAIRTAVRNIDENGNIKEPRPWKQPKTPQDEGGYLGEHPTHAKVTVDMSPDEYLGMTHGLNKAQADEMGNMHPAHPKVLKGQDTGRTKAIKDRLSKGQEVDPAFIDIDVDTGLSFTEGLQQGDHRALAAAELGMPTMPVVLRVFKHEGRRWRPATPDEMANFRFKTPEAPVVKTGVGGINILPDGTVTIRHKSGADLPSDIVRGEGGHPEIVPKSPTEYRNLPEDQHIPKLRGKDTELPEGSPAEYDRYRAMHSEAQAAHAADPNSPVMPHPEGPTMTVYSIGGGLVETVWKNAKGIIVKRKNHTYVSPAWLRTNAELVAKMDNAFDIGRLYGLDEDIPELVKLSKKLADTSHPVKVEELLRELETHGINIDGGAAAGIKALRYDLMAKGIGQLGPMRVFHTMTTYGMTQPIAGAAENLYQVGKATNVGIKGKAGRAAAMGKLRDLSEKVYLAEPGRKQELVQEYWKMFKENLGPDELKKLNRFNRRIQWARGKRYVESILGNSYLPGKNAAGELIERSMVTPGTLPDILEAQHAAALRHFDELWDEHEGILRDNVDTLEQAYHAQHVAPGAAPVTGTVKRTKWKNNERTVTHPDGTVYKETRQWNKKTKRYTPGDKTYTSHPHTGVKTKQGAAGGKELSEARRKLAAMQRIRDKVLTQPGIQSARYDVIRQAHELGATEDDIRKLARAVNDASERVAMRMEAAETLQKLGKKKGKLTQSEQRDFDRASQEMASYATQQPFKMGQTRTHIVHDFDPRIASYYMSGKTAQTFMLFDQAVAEPFMRLFKETVMGNLGFPARVNIGDELARLLPEGAAARYYTVRKAVHELKQDGTDFTEFEARYRDGLAADFDTANTTGEWHALTPDSPGYYQALKDDLASWGREPIVQRLIASKNWGGQGNFPRDLTQIRGFIRRMRDERVKGPLDKDGNPTMVLSQDARDMRNFLEDTYRTEKGAGPISYNTKMFNEWLDGWEDRLTIIGRNDVLRKAIRDGASVDDLKTWGSANPQEVWPVNAPLRSERYGRSGNPLYAMNYGNPFHYMYKYGTTRVMNKINSFTKDILFADRYYAVRNKLLERNKLAQADGAPLMSMDEIHKLAGDEAARHALTASYSRSTTMFEDMSRNMIPFISAYRQFFVYWGSTALKHPVSMSAFKEMYPEAMQDPFSMASGNTQFIIPAIPFWGPNPSDDEGGGRTFSAQIKAQLPSASFIPLLPVRAAISMAGGDPKDFAGVPGLSGLNGKMAPYQMLAKLFYGVGVPTWGPEWLDIFLGDREKLAAAHANYVLFSTKYGPHGIEENLPDWAKPLARFFNAIGLTEAKPDVLYNLFVKTFNMTPVGMIYSPEPTRKMQNAYFDYKKAFEAGDERGMNLVRANNREFDLDMTYKEASPEEKLAMRMDPANKDMLKWWTNAFNYDNANEMFAPTDWSADFFGNGGRRKNDAELLASYNNLYVDIHGGYYQIDAGHQTRGAKYGGDIARQKAEERTKKLIEDRLKWAKGVATQISKERGWNVADMMYKFRNPGGVEGGVYTDWGIWNQIIADKGLNPHDYNIQKIDEVFKAKWGTDNRDKPWSMSPDDLLKAHQLSRWMASPVLERRMVNETPLSGQIAKTQKQLKQAILKAQIAIAGDHWYYLTGEQLDAIGTGISKAGAAKVNVAQLDLKKAYEAFRAQKAGTQEYKDARNSYYALQKKLLGGIKGAECLIGGLDDRLEYIDHFTKPDLISIGAGPQADNQLRHWNEYKSVRNAEMKKDKPDYDAINAAWKKFNGDKAGDTKIERRQMELNRVRNWHTVLELAHSFRKKLRNSYSDYYEARGNSAYSNDGKAYAKQLNQAIELCVKDNPLFADDIKTYFGEDANVGGRLIDWYAY